VLFHIIRRSQSTERATLASPLASCWRGRKSMCPIGELSFGNGLLAVELVSDLLLIPSILLILLRLELSAVFGRSVLVAVVYSLSSYSTTSGSPGMSVMGGPKLDIVFWPGLFRYAGWRPIGSDIGSLNMAIGLFGLAMAIPCQNFVSRNLRNCLSSCRFWFASPNTWFKGEISLRLWMGLISGELGQNGHITPKGIVRDPSF
jgi:hypothetical protein